MTMLTCMYIKWKVFLLFLLYVILLTEMPETIKLMSTNLKNAFLKATESGITKRQTIKVMIVGSESAGKTCLLRRLMNKEIDDVKSTDGINIERGKCQIDIKTGEWHFCSGNLLFFFS